MINYRVDNLELLVVELKKQGVEICDEIESFEYGKFVHIMDPEGNKIELWDPIDAPFTPETEGKTTCQKNSLFSSSQYYDKVLHLY